VAFTLSLEAVVAWLYGRPAFADLVALARRVQASASTTD
jgi:hypothetical protein